MSELLDVTTWRQMVSDSLNGLAQATARLVPALVSAIVILLVGWVVSWVASAIAGRALRRFGFDRACTQLRITTGLRRARIMAAPSVILAQVVRWVVFLVFVVPAAEALGLEPINRVVEEVFAYLPRLAAATLVVVLGMLLRRFVGNLIRSAGAVANLAQTSQLASVAQAVVVLVTAVLTLGQLGVETSILVTVVTVLIATFGLTFGVTFALGARPLVTHILAGHSLRALLHQGMSVEIAGRKGVVERVGAVETVFRDGDRRWSLANGALLEEVIVQ
jgi:hypothetical protein